MKSRVQILLFLLILAAAAGGAALYYRNRPVEQIVGEVGTLAVTPTAGATAVIAAPTGGMPLATPRQTATLLTPTSAVDTPTSSPTRDIPAATNTVAPSGEPLISGSPQDWLPQIKDIPAELKLVDSGSGTNEEIANQFENSAEVLEKLEAWGRSDNYMQIFVHEEGCNLTEGLREIYVQAVKYETEDGAAQALAWYVERNSVKALKTEETDAVGNNAHIFWLNDLSDCQPADELSIISVGFRRNNVLGFVDVGSLLSDEEDPNLQTLALRLAQIIDYNLFSNAQ